MEIQRMIEKVREKYAGKNPGVDTIKKAQGFIVFSVMDRYWNKFGGRNSSGITIREGWYAFDGKKEIELIPMCMWRDGEDQRNDKPQNCWRTVSIEGYAVTFENDFRLKKVIELDF